MITKTIPWSTPNMIGRRFHRTMEMIPARPVPGSLKAPLLPPLFNNVQTRERKGYRRGTARNFLHSFPLSGAPVVQSYWEWTWELFLCGCANWSGDKFGESLGGSQATPSFSRTSPEVPQTSPEAFRRLPRKFSHCGTLQQSRGSPEVSQTSPEVPPDFPGSFPDFPGGQPLSLGSLTPCPDSQKLSLS